MKSTTTTTNKPSTNPKRRSNRNKKSSKANRSSSPMYSVCWAGVLLSLAAKSTAFEGTRLPLAMQTSPRPGFQVETLKRVHPTSSVRLNFRDQDDGGMSTATGSSSSSKQGWWTSLFSVSPETASSMGSEITEQEEVDDYLEFLDRRYRRLHTEENVKEESKQPFSAMQWIRSGSYKTQTISEAQQKDALYVLGVAGLASQKLLQRHPIDQAKKQKSSPTKLQTAGSSPTRRPSLDTSLVPTVELAPVDATTVGHNIAQAILPFLRVIYVVQHRRRQTAKFVAALARKLGRTVLRSTVNTAMHFPRTVLRMGGGKENLALTVAFASTLFFLLSPVVKAIVAEGTM